MNYIGSKYSLLDFLHETIREVTGYAEGEEFVFADLFAGTGVVGASYRKQGCKVIANDIQYYSYVLNKHLIENTTSDERLVDRLNCIDGVDGFVFQNYCEGSGSGRKYFTDENGRRCDAIRMMLEELFAKREIDEQTYYQYLASLINSIDKYANTASVYGAFLKSFKKSAQKDLRLELMPVVDGKKGEVYNEDVNAIIKRITGDVLYLDPPYNARQYCTNYHVLETIALYDNPVLRGKTGLRDYATQKSKFCSKRTVKEVFSALLCDARFKYIFLSYNNEGLMSVEEIAEIMSKYGEYKCFTKEYRRFKADVEEKRNIKVMSTREYLHCLIKR